MTSDYKRVVTQEVRISEAPEVGPWTSYITAAVLLVFLIGVGWLNAGGTWDFEKKSLVPMTPLLAVVLYNFLFYQDFVDEVIAGPNYLIVRKNEETTLVPLSHIMNVTFRHASRRMPQRFTVRIAMPTRFGRRFRFVPTSGYEQSWPPLPATEFLRKRARR